MSVEKKFEENRGIVNPVTQEIDFVAFSTFLEREGRDRAIGYLLALEDMRRAFSELLIRRLPDGSRDETPGRIRQKHQNLGNHLDEFFRDVESLGVWVNGADLGGLQGKTQPQ